METINEKIALIAKISSSIREAQDSLISHNGESIYKWNNWANKMYEDLEKLISENKEINKSQNETK